MRSGKNGKFMEGILDEHEPEPAANITSQILAQETLSAGDSCVCILLLDYISRID